MTPKLSIVTICYRDRAGLRATIDSLRKQSTHDFEHWVVDGGSTDGTVEDLRELQVPWDFHFVSEPDKGLYDAMNKGTQRASGEFVWYLNSGDTAASPDAVEKLLATIQRESADVFYARVWGQSEYGKRSVGGPLSSPQSLMLGLPTCHQGIVYRRKWALQFPYSTEHRIVSDWIMTRQLFEAGAQFQFLNFHLANFDMAGISSQNHWRLFREKYAYEKSIGGRLRLLVGVGLKLAVISCLKKLGAYTVLKRLQHRGSVHP